MAWLSNLFSGFTLNPGLAAAGIGLIAIPIIIHLINRMRYRTVRFAAMEFLLASQQKNRRRVLIEQLILLLLRILIVAGLVFLIARLVLNPEALALFNAGAKTHHVILIDDSGSMRERNGQQTAFESAKDIVRQFVSEASRESSNQQLTVMLLSRAGANEALLSQQDINDDVFNQLDVRLENSEPTHQSLSLSSGLDAIRERLLADGTGQRVLHVVSDFRSADWIDQPGYLEELVELSESNVAVNLVRVVAEEQGNLAVTRIEGDLGAIAAEIPVRVRVGVTNFGREPVKDVELGVRQNGDVLPVTQRFSQIEPGAEAIAEVDVAFPIPGRHSLRFDVNDDALPSDNQRFAAVDVAATLPVLLIDGTPGQGDAPGLIADALAPAPGLSGLSPRIETIDYLRRESLESYRAIFLLNVPSLPRDAQRVLERYVAQGGGIAWFLGDSVQPVAYNSQFFPEQADTTDEPESQPATTPKVPLFPIPLAETRVERTLNTESETLDIRFEPVGRFTPFAQDLGKYWNGSHVSELIPPREDWEPNDEQRADGVQTVARLSDGRPIILRHEYGQGRVVTVLTSAGQDWTNWPRQFIFIPFLLETFKELTTNRTAVESRVVGSALEWKLPAADFSSEVRIEQPDGSPDSIRLTPTKSEDGPTTLVGRYVVTDLPGVYRVMTSPVSGGVLQESWVAMNVPQAESRLELAEPEALKREIGDATNISIRNPGDLGWLRVQEAGHDVRIWLIGLLIAFLIAEQAMSYRLSYHPKTELSPARP